MLKKFINADGWSKVVVLFLWSGAILGKATGYVGLAIGGFVLFSPRLLWDRWYVALTRGGDLLHRWAWALLVSLLYGFGELIYGLLQGYPVFTALQILVFNVCPVFIFLGIWVGARHPAIVRAFNRYSAWFIVFYTPLYFVFFNKLNISLSGILPGNDLVLLANAGSGSSTLIGLLSYEPNLAKFWLPLLVLVCLTIANQERADWLALGIALLIWGYCSKKIGRVFAITGIIAGVLAIAALIDLRLPPIPGRGGELSARGTIARMAGSISPDLAAEAGDRTNAHFYFGTVYWRQHWWAAIRNEVGKEYKTLIFGMGYGYPLARLAGADVEKQGTRSPHNILYFAFGYSGLIGVAIFVWLEICLIRVLWRVFKETGQVFGLVFFAYQLVQALFGNSIETPQAGILVYLVLGLAIGPIFIQRDTESQLEYSPHDMLPPSTSEAFPEIMEHAPGD